MGMIATLFRADQKELNAFLEDSSALETKIYDENFFTDPNVLDLDKTWDAILYLLTGAGVGQSEHPLRKVIFSEQFIDEEQDLGYGPAHYSTSDEVKALNDSLSALRVDDLLKNINGVDMDNAGIYPSWGEIDDEQKGYLKEILVELQKFYSMASANNQAVISYLG